MSLVSLQPALGRLVSSLPTSYVDEDVRTELVKKTLDETKTASSPENRKSQWEYLLKNEVLNLAATEGEALKDEETKYYDRLRDMLDLVLTFTELEACDQTFPFIVLQDLLETQTITSCSHIFTWIETRAPRLTEGMVPQKGKALVLLRTLNDLLRRLSKMGNMTIFCGRILTFLSGVFPLGERSGVNLRGEYGPTWEGVKIEPPQEEEKTKEETKEGAESVAEEASDENKMQVDSEPKKDDKAAELKMDLYNTFWALQLPFSKPSVFANPATFPEFKEGVMKVLPVIKEANAKERLMMGSKGGASNGSLKRKRDEDTEDVAEEYFFAKFLTSPDLLDLEIADTYFRRQFLFQLLILLSHLLNFTKTAKATWQTTRNRSLQMDFTLSDTDAQWVQETFNKGMEELRQTIPNGRTFAETATVILERDKNWIRWKNELCAPFDKEPWGIEVEEEVEVDGKKEKKKRKIGLEEATEEIRQKMREPPEEWQWRFGSESLTEIWEMGYRDLEDLQTPFHAGDIRDFAKKIMLEDRRIEMRTKQLKQQQERREAMRAAAAAKAAAAAAAEAEANKPPVIVEPQPQSAAAEAAAASLVQSSASPLHPSLPAKPVSGPQPPTASSSAAPVSTGPPASTTVPSAPSVTGTPTPVPAPAPVPATPVPAPLPPDDQIKKAEESKERWSWLALRTAREQHLQLFGKIGTGDVQALVQEIEKEREEKEREKKEKEREKENKDKDKDTIMKTSESPNPTKSDSPAPENPSPKVDPEGDVKMDAA
ncbi:UDP-glucose-4-epimerase [Marasmius tenuissimus]|uniref:UDP-glucose-4-epimerase n=1 Tax=Marasmius tenuissimus TaxID=585030 RepID=A0ABR3A4H8_9AGAR